MKGDLFTLSDISKMVEIVKRDKILFKSRARETKDELEKFISKMWVSHCDQIIVGLECVKKMRMKEEGQKELPK